MNSGAFVMFGSTCCAKLYEIFTSIWTVIRVPIKKKKLLILKKHTVAITYNCIKIGSKFNG
jgi:hypothetical protein